MTLSLLCKKKGTQINLKFFMHPLSTYNLLTVLSQEIVLFDKIIDVLRLQNIYFDMKFNKLFFIDYSKTSFYGPKGC